MSSDLSLFERRFKREKAARKEAESFLEKKSLELYQANEKLKKLNEELEQKVKDRSASLKRSEQLYKTVVGSLKSGVLLEDETRHIVLVNQNFCDLFSIPVKAETMKGMDCSKSAEDSMGLFLEPERFVSRVHEILNSKETVIAEKLHLANGRVFSRDYIPIFLGNNYVGHLWKYDDITEEEKVKDLITESEEKYRGIIENMDLGIMEVDLNDRITKVYDKFCSMVGYSREELLGQKAMDILLPSDDYVETIESQNKNREKGESGVYEIPIKKKNGELIWTVVSGAPIIDRSGQLIGSVGVHLDVSDKKRTQETLEEARQIAENARLQEKRFLANMSHDIRTPINGIIGLTHLLRDTSLSEKQFEYVSGIKYSSDMLLSLVSDVLDISKIEAGAMKLLPKEFSLNALVKNVLQPFKLQGLEKNISIELHYDHGIKNRVIGDPSFLAQILMNLLSNAVKFTEKGSVSLDIGLVSETKEILNISFQVKDTGIGISQEKQNEIFDSYRQADNTIKSKFGGTGLGLAIVKQLVSLHGGEIELNSKKGLGSIFSFTIPFKNSPVKDSIKVKDEPIPLKSAGKRVLVVEDNELNITYISALLSKWDVIHEIAKSLHEAKLLMSKFYFDLILMDVSLGDGSGLDLTQSIRDNLPIPQSKVPILALSASAFTEDVQRAKDAGMNDFLPKPFSPDQLYSLLSKYMDSEGLVQVLKTNNNVDLEFIETYFNGDKKQARLMISLFLKTIPPEIRMLEKAILNNDAALAGKIAHKIKPSLGIMGLSQEMEKMKLCEKFGKEGDLNQLKNTFLGLKDDLDITMGQLRDIKI